MKSSIVVVLLALAQGHPTKPDEQKLDEVFDSEGIKFNKLVAQENELMVKEYGLSDFAGKQRIVDENKDQISRLEARVATLGGKVESLEKAREQQVVKIEEQLTVAAAETKAVEKAEAGLQDIVSSILNIVDKLKAKFSGHHIPKPSSNSQGVPAPQDAASVEAVPGPIAAPQQQDHANHHRHHHKASSQ